MRILRAFKPGDIVFIECSRPLPVQAMQHIHAEFKRRVPDVKIIVLQDGLKVSGHEEGPAVPEYMGSAHLAEILLERQRQVQVEGFDDSHDDEHDAGELSAAAACYALHAADVVNPNSQGDGGYEIEPPIGWPWDRAWWKPSGNGNNQRGSRRDLVKAAALILAELERMDRLEQAPA